VAHSTRIAGSPVRRPTVVPRGPGRNRTASPRWNLCILARLAPRRNGYTFSEEPLGALPCRSVGLVCSVSTAFACIRLSLPPIHWLRSPRIHGLEPSTDIPAQRPIFAGTAPDRGLAALVANRSMGVVCSSNRRSHIANVKGGPIACHHPSREFRGHPQGSYGFAAARTAAKCSRPPQVQENPRCLIRSLA